MFFMVARPNLWKLPIIKKYAAKNYGVLSMFFLISLFHHQFFVLVATFHDVYSTCWKVDFSFHTSVNHSS